MQTAEELGRRLQTTRDLKSVVSTMKALAAVSIRQFERAAESLRGYAHTVELGLQVAARELGGAAAKGGTRPKGPLGLMVLGSDQGMVGSLNEKVAAKAQGFAQSQAGVGQREKVVLAVGERVYPLLDDAGLEPDQVLSVPGSVSGMMTTVQDMLFALDEWRGERGVHEVHLFYSRQVQGAAYEPTRQQLLPVDQAWLAALAARPWQSRGLPMHTMPTQDLLAALIRQFLLVSIYRALAEALASENASRLAAMQGAEKNIAERLEELEGLYNRQRQSAIDAELLDITAGFVALGT